MFDAEKSEKVCAVQHVALSDDSKGKKHESEKVCAVQHVALSDNSRGEKTESEKVCAVQHVALSDNLSKAVAGIADGLIPSDLDQLAALGINILAINAKTRQTISVIIAAARQLLSLKDWITWCDDNFHQDTQARSHLAAVGKLLLSILDENQKFYRKLFPLDFEKLYVLTSIPQTQLEAFLVPLIDKLQNMSREQVRCEVAKFLGKPGIKKQHQPCLPGFESILDSLTQADDVQMATAVQSEETASKAVKASQKILNSAIVFYHSSDDILKLHEIKTYIKKELLTELETAIAMLAGGSKQIQ